MEKKKPENIKKIEESEIEEIVLLFLEKLELLNEEERRTIIKTIQILNSPVFIVN